MAPARRRERTRPSSIRDDRVDAVGSASTVKIPAGVQVLDLTGSTVIPGLVGLHEHTWFGGLRVSTPMSVSAPLLYLGMGVTTAMTAGTMFAYQELNLQRAVDAGLVPGPRFLIAGPYIPRRAGRPRRAATGWSAPLRKRAAWLLTGRARARRGSSSSAARPATSWPPAFRKHTRGGSR